MELNQFLQEWNNESPFVEVKTSGSTGAPKQILVEKARMRASARATCRFLGLKEGDSALLCMSLEYIGAKMMVVRALEIGMRLIVVPPCGNPLADISVIPDFAAMVPLQLFNSLQNENEKTKLQSIRHLIIGGGAIAPNIEAAIKDFPHSVWSTYGMTETLSHIALRRINGPHASEWYTPFDGIKTSTTIDQRLVIEAPEIATNTIVTNDIVEILPDGRFKVLGRSDNIINSGGIKIQIEEVELKLQEQLSLPFAIGSRKSEKFGEEVVLLTEDTDLTAIQEGILTLPPYWRPKHCFHVEKIPTAGNGKIARKEIKILIDNLTKNE